MSSYVCVVLILFVLSISASSLEDQFQSFVNKYGKKYESGEYSFRKNVFQANMIEIDIIQAKNPLAKFGVNEFSDLTNEEFSSIFLSNLTGIEDQKINFPFKTNFKGPRHSFLVSDPDPNNYDWNDAGVVTGVYQQGQCGDCWAFAATETIESYWAIAGDPLVQLSMEQIIDCNARSAACGGGVPDIAYGYVIKAGGIESLDAYPYVAEGGTPSNCSFNGSIAAYISSAQQIAGEGGLYSQLSSGSGGPVTVCVDASTWRGYQGGILTSCPSNLDHCVQATGYANYGQSNAYWIVRNSWGTNWGNSGYIYIAIGSDLCGIGDRCSIVSI